MKKGILYIAVVTAAVSVASCNKPSCVPPNIKTVSFYPASSVPDTTATVVKFNKGSNFSQVSEAFTDIALDKNKVMVIPYKGGETYDYDWQITLNPSGKVYYIKDIKHDDTNPNTTNCVSTVTYKLNDSTKTIQGSPYSMTPSTLPEIKIKY
jgi:hypothetical protein